jgi:hypothetical protein
MDWQHLLAYITGTVDQALLLRNEYLVTENRILRNQITGRVRLSDGERKTLAAIGSCTSWLRVIRLIQESGKMAPHYTMMRGHCHDSAPRVLPAGRHRIPLVMYHAALYLAEPKCGVPSAANGTRTHQV